ncbi:glycosyltransferase [Pseudonocardia sp. S2-4]|uniref:Glycosyltransferase n=2 Tax=Pseudonocardia humida TaxID=2800819 RepID=A0ABT1A5F4_9PSEU|nr:glycosyltransferase [Pseudonocardia humida]
MGVGGAESLVCELVRRGRSRGWISSVASAGGVRADELAAEGVAIFPVPMARRSASGVARAALATHLAVRKAQPDVVIAHNVGATVVARLAVGRRIPVITVFHGVAEEDYPRAAQLLRRADTVVAVSAAIAGRLRENGLQEPTPIVIRNAVSPRRSPPRDESRKALDIPPDAPVVLCMARLVPQKRHDVLLDAWARMDPKLRAEKGALLLLAGDGPDREALRKRAEDLGVSGSVRFLGQRDDIPELLSAADVNVLTSDWEGLPISVLEALAAGVPVVASNVDGLSEVLAHGGGRLVPPGDPAAVAEALERLLADPTQLAAMGRAGRQTVARHYDPLAMADRYGELFERVHAVGRRRSRTMVTALLTGLAALLVGGVTFGIIAAQPPAYQARIGLVAGPVTPGPDTPTSQASFGEVVQLGMPAVNELVRAPSVLAGAVGAVDPPADPEALADAIAVEYIPETGVARITVVAGTPDGADALAMRVAQGVVDADVLAPVARLRTLDEHADVRQAAPDRLLATGLALTAASVAAVGVLALRRLTRPTVSRRSRLSDALTLAGASRPVTVLDMADPDLVARLTVLQNASTRPLRLIGTAPGDAHRVRSLTGELRASGAVMQVNGHAGDAAVVALLDGNRTGPDDVTAAVAALPDASALIAVVIT